MQSVTLATLIGFVESTNNFSAYRFEPATFANTQNVRPGNFASDPRAKILDRICKIHNNCSFGTARAIYSASFGEQQIMGFNLWGPQIAYASRFDQFLADPNAQADAFNTFISKVHPELNVTPDELAASHAACFTFGKIYNGNAVAYASSIENALSHFGYTVVPRM